MPRESVPVGPGTRITLTFELRLASGERVDGTGDTPASCFYGDGSLPPGFEAALLGLPAGTEQTLTIPAEQAFGEPSENNVQMLRRTDFGPGIELAEGLVVSFTDAQNAELPGVVRRLLGDLVEVDFNHPLAGRDLLFDVHIHNVEQIHNEIARG